MFFDGVFCIFSTKEVTKSGMILPISITLFLCLFSAVLFAVVSRGSDEGGQNGLFSGSICGFLMGFFAFLQQEKLADVNLNLSILQSCVLSCSGYFLSALFWRVLTQDLAACLYDFLAILSARIKCHDTFYCI